MDLATQAFAKEVASQVVIENWLYWIVLALVCFLATLFGSYLRKRGENLATRDDFEELKTQLKDTTRLTEEIKREIGHAEWKAREVNSIFRTKLEELFRQISVIDHSIRDYIKATTAGNDVSLSIAELDALSAVATLYFPALDDPARAYITSCRDMILWSMGRSEAWRTQKNEGADQAMLTAVINETQMQYARSYRENITLRSALEQQAAELMRDLLYVPDKP